MSIGRFFQEKWREILFVVLAALCLYGTILYLTVAQRGYDHVLVDLAQQFLKGHTVLSIYNLPIRDVADYYNNYYVYFGPLATLLLMPFVAIWGAHVPQISIGIFSIIASYIGTYLIARSQKFSKIDSLFLGMFIVFSTVLFSSSVINITAYQVEALGVPFMLFAIWAYLTKRSGFLVGLFIGLAAMTRYTLMLSTVFFFVELLQKRISVKYFIYLLIPIAIAVLILGGYNQRRFHSVFETGYNYSITKNDGPIGENLHHGGISLVHVPANLYSFLIMPPQPVLTDKKGGMVLKFPYLQVSPWGFAIWYSSPLFFLLLFHFRKGKYTLSAGIATILLMIPVFTWYSVGYAQVGYRYALDFLPFLFLLLLPVLAPKLSKAALLLISIGVLFTLIYSESIWGMYPLFHMF